MPGVELKIGTDFARIADDYAKTTPTRYTFKHFRDSQSSSDSPSGRSSSSDSPSEQDSPSSSSAEQSPRLDPLGASPNSLPNAQILPSQSPRAQRTQLPMIKPSRSLRDWFVNFIYHIIPRVITPQKMANSVVARDYSRQLCHLLLAAQNLGFQQSTNALNAVSATAIAARTKQQAIATIAENIKTMHEKATRISTPRTDGHPGDKVGLKNKEESVWLFAQLDLQCDGMNDEDRLLVFNGLSEFIAQPPTKALGPALEQVIRIRDHLFEKQIYPTIANQTDSPFSSQLKELNLETSASVFGCLNKFIADKQLESSRSASGFEQLTSLRDRLFEDKIFPQLCKTSSWLTKATNDKKLSSFNGLTIDQSFHLFADLSDSITLSANKHAGKAELPDVSNAVRIIIRDQLFARKIYPAVADKATWLWDIVKNPYSKLTDEESYLWFIGMVDFTAQSDNGINLRKDMSNVTEWRDRFERNNINSHVVGENGFPKDQNWCSKQLDKAFKKLSDEKACSMFIRLTKSITRGENGSFASRSLLLLPVRDRLFENRIYPTIASTATEEAKATATANSLSQQLSTLTSQESAAYTLRYMNDFIRKQKGYDRIPNDLLQCLDNFIKDKKHDPKKIPHELAACLKDFNTHKSERIQNEFRPVIEGICNQHMPQLKQQIIGFGQLLSEKANLYAGEGATWLSAQLQDLSKTLSSDQSCSLFIHLDQFITKEQGQTNQTTRPMEQLINFRDQLFKENIYPQFYTKPSERSVNGPEFSKLTLEDALGMLGSLDSQIRNAETSLRLIAGDQSDFNHMITLISLRDQFVAATIYPCLAEKVSWIRGKRNTFDSGLSGENICLLFCAMNDFIAQAKNENVSEITNFRDQFFSQHIMPHTQDDESWLFTQLQQPLKELSLEDVSQLALRLRDYIASEKHSAGTQIRSVTRLHDQLLVNNIYPRIAEKVTSIREKWNAKGNEWNDENIRLLFVDVNAFIAQSPKEEQLTLELTNIRDLLFTENIYKQITEQKHEIITEMFGKSFGQGDARKTQAAFDQAVVEAKALLKQFGLDVSASDDDIKSLACGIVKDAIYLHFSKPSSHDDFFDFATAITTYGRKYINTDKGSTSDKLLKQLQGNEKLQKELVDGAYADQFCPIVQWTANLENILSDLTTPQLAALFAGQRPLPGVVDTIESRNARWFLDNRIAAAIERRPIQLQENITKATTALQNALTAGRKTPERYKLAEIRDYLSCITRDVHKGADSVGQLARELRESENVKNFTEIAKEVVRSLPPEWLLQLSPPQIEKLANDLKTLEIGNPFHSLPIFGNEKNFVSWLSSDEHGNSFLRTFVRLTDDITSALQQNKPSILVGSLKEFRQLAVAGESLWKYFGDEADDKDPNTKTILPSVIKEMAQGRRIPAADFATLDAVCDYQIKIAGSIDSIQATLANQLRCDSQILRMVRATFFHTDVANDPNSAADTTALAASATESAVESFINDEWLDQSQLVPSREPAGAKIPLTANQCEAIDEAYGLHQTVPGTFYISQGTASDASQQFLRSQLLLVWSDSTMFDFEAGHDNINAQHYKDVGRNHIFIEGKPLANDPDIECTMIANFLKNDSSLTRLVTAICSQRVINYVLETSLRNDLLHIKDGTRIGLFRPATAWKLSRNLNQDIVIRLELSCNAGDTEMAILPTELAKVLADESYNPQPTFVRAGSNYKLTMALTLENHGRNIEETQPLTIDSQEITLQPEEPEIDYVENTNDLKN